MVYLFPLWLQGIFIRLQDGLVQEPCAMELQTARQPSSSLCWLLPALRLLLLGLAVGGSQQLGRTSGASWRWVPPAYKEPGPSPPHTNKTLWSQHETKHLQSVSFLLPLLSPLSDAFPLKRCNALKGGERCGCVKEPFGNVSFHVSEPGQLANQMLSGRLCRLPMGAIHKGIISISSLRGPARFVKALPHTFAHSICSCHLIKGPLTSRRKRGAATLEGVEEAINQGFPA